MKHSVLRRLGALALALALAVPLAAAPAQASPGPILVQSIEVTPPELNVTADQIGQAGTFTVTVLPADASNQTVSWSSSDTKVIRMNQSGGYRIMGEGTAIITAAANDGSGVTGTCQVTVTEPPPAPEPVNSVRIDRTDSSYQTGVSQINLNLPRNATKPVTAQVSATVTYDSHTDHEVVWEVFDPNQAITFDQTTGLITAVGGGTAVITAKARADEKKTASVTVTVTAYGVINLTGVTVSKQELKLGLAESDTLTAAVQPSSVKDKTLSITTEPLGIVDVADVNGKGQQFRVTGIGLGKAKITFTSVYDPTKSAVCEVEVTPALKALTIDGKNSDNQLILTGVGPGDHKLIHATPSSNA